MFLFEAYVTMNILLLLASLLIRSHFMLSRPSAKLKLLRLLLLSCLLSPLFSAFLKGPDQPILAQYVSLDFFAEAKELSKVAQNLETTKKLQTKSQNNIELSGTFLILMIFFLGAFWHARRFVFDLIKLRVILRSSISFRSYRCLQINISEHCYIPFSTRWWNKSYIVLPLSLLHSSLHTKIALAHEGQHHRQGDCIWVYLLEMLRIIFWINPSIYRWQKTMNELQELACDEALVGHQLVSAHDYGRCLYEVAQTALASIKSENRIHACAVTMAWMDADQNQSFIVRRICMLSKYNAPLRKTLFTSILGLLAVLVPLSASYASRGTFEQNTYASSSVINVVDNKIQRIAQAEIDDAVSHYKAKSGVVVVADPKTQKILAFAEAGDRSQSWKSRIFPPASLIKPFVAAASIDEGLSSDDKIYDCQEPYSVAGVDFTNGNPKIGAMRLDDAMANSVNICFVKVAQELGVQRFRDALSRFGFKMKAWNPKNAELPLAQAAVDTGLSFTLSDLVNGYSILANQGKAHDGQQVITELSSKIVTRMMEKVVHAGTGRRAAISGMRVAGKTGTLVSQDSSLALFAGFAPAENARFLSFVILENGMTESGKSGYGSSLAAPVFSKLMSRILDIPKKS